MYKTTLLSIKILTIHSYKSTVHLVQALETVLQSFSDIVALTQWRLLFHEHIDLHADTIAGVVAL
jgi:hypothetical protein